MSSSNLFYEAQLPLELFSEESPECREMLSEFICYLCKGVYFEPVLDSCGHVYCKKCINQHFDRSDICPIYKTKSSRSISKLEFANKILEKYKIKCKNHLFGCNFFDKIAEYKRHDCEYQNVRCHNKDCNFVVYKFELPDHKKKCDFRVIQCDLCKKDCVFKNFNDHECGKKLIPCSLNCGLFIPRDELDIHIRNNCDNNIINCLYLKYGCDENFPRKELKTHLFERNFEHNSMLINEFENRFNEIRKLSIIARKKPFKKKVREIFKKEKPKKYEIVNLSDILEPSNRKIVEDEEAIDQVENKTISSYESERAENTIITRKNKTNEIALNTVDSSKGLKIIVNVVKSKISRANSLFAFADVFLNEKTGFKWRVVIDEVKSWVGFGICDKGKLLSSNYKINYSVINHGVFLLTTKGMIFNSINHNENNLFIKNLNFKLTSYVDIEYKNKERTLTFKVGDKSVTLTKVITPRNANYYPCVVLNDKGDQVTLESI